MTVVLCALACMSRVLRESLVKLFSGSWFDSGSEFGGLFKMFSSGMMTDGVITDTVSGTVVGPSGMVLDGIFADPFADQGSAAACGCSSSAAASKRSSCSGPKVSNTALGEMKEEKKGAVLCQIWKWYVVCCPQFLLTWCRMYCIFMLMNMQCVVLV